MRRVSIGQYFKTIHDVDDELMAWVGGHTRTGPVSSSQSHMLS